MNKCSESLTNSQKAVVDSFKDMARLDRAIEYHHAQLEKLQKRLGRLGGIVQSKLIEDGLGLEIEAVTEVLAKLYADKAERSRLLKLLPANLNEIITLRYIKGMDWYAVAQATAYSLRSVHLKHKQALEILTDDHEKRA